MDNRHGLVVNTRLTQASGIAEPEAALAMAADIPGWGRSRWALIRVTIKRNWCGSCARMELPHASPIRCIKRCTRLRFTAWPCA